MKRFLSTIIITLVLIGLIPPAFAESPWQTQTFAPGENAVHFSGDASQNHLLTAIDLLKGVPGALVEIDSFELRSRVSTSADYVGVSCLVPVKGWWNMDAPLQVQLTGSSRNQRVFELELRGTGGCVQGWSFDSTLEVASVKYRVLTPEIKFTPVANSPLSYRCTVTLPEPNRLHIILYNRTTGEWMNPSYRTSAEKTTHNLQALTGAKGNNEIDVYGSMNLQFQLDDTMTLFDTVHTVGADEDTVRNAYYIGTYTYNSGKGTELLPVPPKMEITSENNWISLGNDEFWADSMEQLVRAHANGPMKTDSHRAAAFSAVLAASGKRGAAIDQGNSPAEKAVLKIGCKGYAMGNETLTDTAPFIQNGRTYLPLRYAAYAAGAAKNQVYWDQTSQTAWIRTKESLVQLTPSGTTVYVGTIKSGEVQKVQLKNPLMNAEGRLCLPVSEIASLLSLSTEWDAKNRLVIIR